MGNNKIIIPTIEELAPYYFTFEYLRAGSLTEFGIQTRTYSIEQNRQTIRQYEIGYLKAEKLWFKEQHFWTHLTTKEFEICFPELKEYTENIKS